MHAPEMPASLADWLAAAPRLDTDWFELRQVYKRSLIDLAALRFYPESVPDSSLPAAGLPWFMALIGRDSLITSYQAIPFVPELARTTLLALGAHQATGFDDFRDAEPGKILHELRHGELAQFGERPHSPYYGSADATPLFLVVLDEYERWTGDTETVRHLEGAARAAVEWMERHGDSDGDGYIEYQTRNPKTGLVNQCWKDSGNSIVHPDGRLATLPRACCEIQGYAYDARVRAARLAREVWGDPAFAERLEQDAAALRDRFDRDFWLPDLGFYALALDGDKKPVGTLTSNMGHLLWSGIVADERVEAVVAQLTGEAMYSGWGVRTLGTGQPVYSPIEYHNGTVWPHDTALIALGLARYGRRAEANKLVVALMDAAGHFAFRLPEAFAGYPREQTLVPVEYPSACSPQAWATGAPLLFLRIMLGLEPTANGLTVRPHLPAEVNRLLLRGVPGRWGRADAVAVRERRKTDLGPPG
jgi:glycogen debranching enzyme